MGLGIAKETDYGVDAKYWHIGAYQEDFRGRGAEATMYGYADRKSRTDGAQPLEARIVRIEGKEYKPDMSREEVYKLLVKREDWKTAKMV